jgi:hypothetical protein
MGVMDHPDCPECKAGGVSTPKFFCTNCGTQFCGRCESIPSERQSPSGVKTCPRCGDRNCTQSN